MLLVMHLLVVTLQDILAASSLVVVSLTIAYICVTLPLVVSAQMVPDSADLHLPHLASILSQICRVPLPMVRSMVCFLAVILPTLMGATHLGGQGNLLVV